MCIRDSVNGDDFCYVPGTDVKTLGEIVYLLGSFRDSRETLSVPDLKMCIRDRCGTACTPARRSRSWACTA